MLFGLANRCVRIAFVAPPDAPFRRALDVAELSQVAFVADSPHEALKHFALRMIVDCAHYRDGVASTRARWPGGGGGDLPARPRASCGSACSSPRPTSSRTSRTSSACTSWRSRTRRASTCGPKFEAYDDGIRFVVLRTARYDDEREEVEFGEISIFIGPDFVITVRQGIAAS